LALVDELWDLARPECRMHAGHGERRREIDAADRRGRVRRAQHRRVQHPVQAHVGGVLDLPAGALEAVHPRRRSPDDVARPCRPLLEGVLVDDEPHLLVPALDLLLRADQSRHVRIASSIFGYAPQRQRLPAIACRISRELGAGLPSTSATALTICPGVQKPHWSASARTKELTIGWSRSPSIVVTRDPATLWTSVMHESVGTPSMSTVHAPQWPSPQATLVPVSDSSSRSASASVVPTLERIS